MSIFDLTKTSFIIHFRRDSEERVRNLNIILNFLNKNINYENIYIINDDSNLDPFMEEISIKYPSLELSFFKNDDAYMRPYCFNKISKIAKGEVLCFYDIDVLINPKDLEIAQNKILSGELDHVYPYSGLFVNIKNINNTTYLPNFEELLKFIPSNIEIGYNDSNIDICNTESYGGCFLIRKTSFEKINGYNPNFKGWGNEDISILRRSSLKNKIGRITSPNAICWHLDHTRNDLNNPYINYNFTLQ